MTTTNTYGRQVVVPLTNKSGGGVIAGDVVVIDTSNNDAFTTSTAGAFTGLVGVAQETIANNATGRILTAGYAALVNTSASVTRGNFGKTHTVVKQAVDAGSSRVAGAFCQFLTGGTTPDAHVFGIADNTSGAGTGTLTTVKDEGSNLSTAVASIDFVGAGVTATGTTAVTVTIPAGGITRTTQGKTTAGASFAARGVYVVKLTLSSAAIISAIHAFVKGDGSGQCVVEPIIYSDAAGVPTNIIFSPLSNITAAPARVFGMILNTTVRDLAVPCGMYLAAGDYWFGVYTSDNTGTTINLANTATGGTSATVGGGVVNQPVDSSIQALTTNSVDYSIYIDVLR